MFKGLGAAFVGAALLASTTAFAQTATTTASSTSKTSAQESPAQPVTLIGCVQKEIDYRKAHNIKRGGRLNTGLGDGDEYILINATRVSPGAPAMASASCSGGSGEAFEITGGYEEKFKPFVGKVVEVSGKQKRAKVGASGTPTGGKDPMNGDLKLFEVEVASVKEASMATAQVDRTETTPPPAATTAPAPAPAVTAPPPAPEPAPTATAGRTETAAPATTALPHTASPLPLFELASLLAFGGAYGVRKLRVTLKK